MQKAHDVTNVSIAGTILRLRVDGKNYEIDLANVSERLAKASREQKANFEVLPSGYGICWPDIDEHLSIDGLIEQEDRLRPEYDLSQLKGAVRGKYASRLAPQISHDRASESPEAKARWFQSLSLAERMDYLCAITDLALSVNPKLADKKHARPAHGRIRVLKLP